MPKPKPKIVQTLIRVMIKRKGGGRKEIAQTSALWLHSKGKTKEKDGG